MADNEDTDRDDLDKETTTDDQDTDQTNVKDDDKGDQDKNRNDDSKNDDTDDKNFDDKDFKESGVDPEEFERTRKALAKANKEAEARRKRLKEWDELGVDPDKVKNLLKEQQNADRKRMEEEGRYRELLEQLEETSESEKRQIREEADQRVNKMRENLEKHFIDRTITEAIASEGANPKLLNRHVKDQVQVIEDDDGEFRTVVVDADGNPRLKRGGSNMTVKDLLQEMKNDDAFAPAFPAPDTSGAGTNASSTGKRGAASAPPTGLKRGDMSIQDRAAYRQKYGKEAYEKLPL